MKSRLLIIIGITIIVALIFVLSVSSYLESFGLPKSYDKDIETVYVIILKGAVIDGNQMLDPEVITIQIGINNTVTWINEDDTAHGITSDNKERQWGSLGVLKPGESFTHTFDEDGVFPYHGEPHPWMSGFVIVLDPDPPQKHMEFDIVDTDLFSLTYKDFGIYTVNPSILSKFILMSNYKESWINVSINEKKHLVKYLVLHLMENRYFQLNH